MLIFLLSQGYFLDLYFILICVLYEFCASINSESALFTQVIFLVIHNFMFYMQGKRRILATDEWLRVKGCEDVYAIGDCATIDQRKIMVYGSVKTFILLSSLGY